MRLLKFPTQYSAAPSFQGLFHLGLSEMGYGPFRCGFQLEDIMNDDDKR